MSDLYRSPLDDGPAEDEYGGFELAGNYKGHPEYVEAAKYHIKYVFRLGDGGWGIVFNPGAGSRCVYVRAEWLDIAETPAVPATISFSQVTASDDGDWVGLGGRVTVEVGRHLLNWQKVPEDLRCTPEFREQHGIAHRFVGTVWRDIDMGMTRFTRLQGLNALAAVQTPTGEARPADEA